MPSGSGIQVRGSGRTLAIATVAGVIGTLGYMYVAGKETKKEEGPVSIYKKDSQLGTDNARMHSPEVRETVQGERKP